MARLHVAPFEGQFAELALDLGLGVRALRQGFGRLESFGRLVVAAAEHEHVAQPFGNAVLRGGVGRRGAALGDAVLLFGDFQRMLGARLFGGRQRVGQRRAALAGGVEMVGQVEDAIRGVFLQQDGDAVVEHAPILVGKPIEQGDANLVVDESATRAVGPDPDEMALPGAVECRDGLDGLLAGQLGGEGQVEFLAQNGADTEQVDRGGGRSSIRRARKPAARLDDCRSARASGSTRQPCGSATRAPDSTMPRSTAEAMKGLPSESSVDRVDRFGGQRAGHRLHQPPHVVGARRGPDAGAATGAACAAGGRRTLPRSDRRPRASARAVSPRPA